MSVNVFTWDMFKFGPHSGVGHASMHVHGPQGNIYISFWPAKHATLEAAYSQGKVHFIRGDKEDDGQPSWASKPLRDLNEARIVEFWKAYDSMPGLDYKGSNSANKTKTNDGGKIYNLAIQQCSTVVVGALLAGADLTTRLKIQTWLALNAGTNFDLGGIQGFSRYLPTFRVPTVTPADVREMVKRVWNDT